MRMFFFLLVVAALIFVNIYNWSATFHPAIIEAYQKNARSSIFTAFVTLGSFLLALKSTMLQRLKEGFDSKAYRKIYTYYLDQGGTGGYYDSLRNISAALATCIPMALGSSALQMTLGFSSTPLAFAFCAALPTTTMLLVLYLWLHINRAHRYWLDKIEDEKQAELESGSTSAPKLSI